MSHRRLVGALFALVLLVSVGNVVLALTKPDSAASAGRPAVTQGRYRPADLAGGGCPALKVAVDSARLALTYDHDALDAGLRRTTATMTPSYARSYRKSFRRSVAPVARKRGTDAVGAVRAAGLLRNPTADRATCLVYLDQRVGAPARSTVTRVVRVDLVRRDGTWLVAALDPI